MVESDKGSKCCLIKKMIEPFRVCLGKCSETIIDGLISRSKFEDEINHNIKNFFVSSRCFNYLILFFLKLLYAR